MAICLGINEDIIKLFKKYDDLKVHKKPEAFISSFHTDYAEYNLNNQKENRAQKYSENSDNFGFPASNSVVGNPGNNLTLIDFGKGSGDNSSNKIPNQNSSSQNQPGDIFDFLNQFNK